MTGTVVTKLNDVDIARVASLAEKIQQEPHVADSKWSAEVKWKGGFCSEATIRDFAPTTSDEPEQLGLLRGELIRAIEFAGGAMNKSAGAELRGIAMEMGIDLDDLVARDGEEEDD